MSGMGNYPCKFRMPRQIAIIAASRRQLACHDGLHRAADDCVRVQGDDDDKIRAASGSWRDPGNPPSHAVAWPLHCPLFVRERRTFNDRCRCRFALYRRSRIDRAAHIDAPICCPRGLRLPKSVILAGPATRPRNGCECVETISAQVEGSRSAIGHRPPLRGGADLRLE